LISEIIVIEGSLFFTNNLFSNQLPLALANGFRATNMKGFSPTLLQKIKGESSFWINKNKLTRLKFEWQDDFYSVSIGMEQLDTLREYIRNQVEHHRKISFQEELDKLIKEYKLKQELD
jgi:hypothetical protein